MLRPIPSVNAGMAKQHPVPTEDDELLVPGCSLQFSG